MSTLFKVEPEDIGLLDQYQLTWLLNELLCCEASQFGIPLRYIHVATNINDPDDGEDGRIRWESGPNETDFLTQRYTMFQNKASKMTKGKYANHIVQEKNKHLLKVKIEEVLSAGGTYIIFTTQKLNTKEKDERITAIRRKLLRLGKEYSNTCDIKIYDASQISNWANKFAAAIISIKTWNGRPLINGLKSYKAWSEDRKLSSFTFISVESREEIITTLKSELLEPKSCFRIIGLSGLGKTRTAFQVFTESEELRELAVYVDASQVPNIDAIVMGWIGNVSAILIVDNCDYQLHGRLVTEVRRENSKISLLTLDYNMETVSNLTKCFRLTPMSSHEIMQMLTPKYGERLSDLHRISQFAQGFPQIAVLIADARLMDDPRVGELTDDEVVKKLIWRRNEQENDNRLKILQTCSLFDFFGVKVDIQLQFISDRVGLNIDDVYKCVNYFADRGIVDLRGRFGQVVPKPLAIRLAGQWWANQRDTVKNDFIEQIPDQMVESFCNQLEKMDSHRDVKSLGEALYGIKGPFGQAEMILSIRGSRFFRSFTVVNPDSTSDALYRMISLKSVDELLEITGTIRRNLIWGLERLCFHYRTFSESAWCLLLLANAENESYGNNATDRFTQLFRIYLSGTEANPQKRFNLLRKAIKLELESIDLIVIKALSEALSLNSGIVAHGTEYQGSGAPLVEWKTSIWQEIFDYWQESYDILLELLKRGETQELKVKIVIGHSIRTMIKYGRVEMLDSVLKKVADNCSRYWPAALDSLSAVYKYDYKNLNQAAKDAVESWFLLLSPERATLSEKIKILVINPPWETDEINGQFVDTASEKAKKFGEEVAKDVDQLIPYCEMLLEGEPRQSFSFGYQIARSSTNLNGLINKSLEILAEKEDGNINFLSGILKGIFEKSKTEWEKILDLILANNRLVQYYPKLIRTGKIEKKQLDELLKLVSSGRIQEYLVDILSYGSVTSNIAQKTIGNFCLSFAEISEDSKVYALNIIYMYCWGRKDSFSTLRETLKTLVIKVSIHRIKMLLPTNLYRWVDLVKRLLDEPVENDFVKGLIEKLIKSTKTDFNYSDVWSFFQPLMALLLKTHTEITLEMWGEAIEKADGMDNYWLKEFFKREDRYSSIFSSISVERLINWCEVDPAWRPSFISRSINIFERDGDQQVPSKLFVELLSKFGADEQVVTGLFANIGSFSWVGSMVPYLEADKAALSSLLDNENQNVINWVKREIASLEDQIKTELIRDDERHFGIF